jgi:hypothetical protein
MKTVKLELAADLVRDAGWDLFKVRDLVKIIGLDKFGFKSKGDLLYDPAKDQYIMELLGELPPDGADTLSVSLTRKKYMTYISNLTYFNIDKAMIKSVNYGPLGDMLSMTIYDPPEKNPQAFIETKGTSRGDEPLSSGEDQ